MSTIAGSPTEVVIRDGHRALVTTFREVARSLDASGDRVPEPETLRAVVAFLRQGLLPFADWEQKQLARGAEVAEDTAFEHAFLNAEVDALAAAVAERGREPERNQTGIAQRIRRGVHRIDAAFSCDMDGGF